jgi:putative endonuclease
MDMSAAINTRIPWAQKPVFMPFASLTARCGRSDPRAMAVKSRRASGEARRYPQDAVAGSSADAPRDPRHRFGAFGEEAAVEYLRRRGFEILARNVRTAFGEMDVVAMDGDTVVFVEVKSRRTRRGGTALEAVDARKRKRLSRLALAFLARAGWLDRRARFDVVAVASDGACTHVANAFDCGPT